MQHTKLFGTTIAEVTFAAGFAFKHVKSLVSSQNVLPCFSLHKRTALQNTELNNSLQQAFSPQLFLHHLKAY